MFRMQVEFYAEEDLFTTESVSFLKDKFNDEIYDVIAKSIQDPRYIEVPVWPGLSYDEDWIRPEDVFSAMVNHFKSEGLTIIVRPDEDKFNKEDYNIPENYWDVYYKYEFHKENFGSDEIENGEVVIGLDGDNAYAYDPDEDEEVLVNDIEDAEWIELY